MPRGRPKPSEAVTAQTDARGRTGSGPARGTAPARSAPSKRALASAAVIQRVWRGWRVRKRVPQALRYRCQHATELPFLPTAPLLVGASAFINALVPLWLPFFPSLTSLSLRGCHALDPKLVAALVAGLPSLQSLDLAGAFQCGA